VLTEKKNSAENNTVHRYRADSNDIEKYTGDTAHW